MALRADQVSLIGQVFESYLLQHHRDDILSILRQGDDEAHYPVLVDALTLFETNMEIGEYFNAFPSQVLPIFDGALRRAAMAVLQAATPSPELRMKPNLHARISGEWRAGRQLLLGLSDSPCVVALVNRLCEVELRRPCTCPLWCVCSG